MAAFKSYIADLHIHSLYSRATSKASNLKGLAAWAAVKGIDVVGTGDFTHPGWFSTLTKQLEPAEPGFFRLREQPSPEELAAFLPPGIQPDTSKVRFVLSAEISSIYKRGGRVRKIHNILFTPDFASARKINTTLAGIGNIEADGRPILGLDSRILLEILLEHAPQGFLVPAHIWTPWFSLFGSKSGFDAIEECFGDLSCQIFALETGLSSDPEMNRCVSALDRFSLISNSDCHSPSKLGREANIFTAGFDYFSMQDAIRNPMDSNRNQRFAATIEFYPEEGKYHCDGHRKCGVCFEPSRTVKEKGICPRCGRPLTIGVLYRVMELADRSGPVYPQGSPSVHSLVPLVELLGELFNTGPATKRVAAVYGKLIQSFGSEFNLLLSSSIDDIRAASPMLATAVERVREKKVIRKPGFDGEFGVIKVFSDEERDGLGGQLNLFGISPARKARPRHTPAGRINRPPVIQESVPKKPLNPQQQAAVDSTAPHIIVKAGPGTGKTHTLIQRVVRLQQDQTTPVTVITFTNKAAEEVRQRLTGRTPPDAAIRVSTFHGYCLHWLRRNNPGLLLAGPETRKSVFSQLFPELSNRVRTALQRQVSLFLSQQARLPDTFPEPIRPYFVYLRRHNLFDLDEVVPACTALMADDFAFAAALRAETGQLLVDEFQDLNAGQYELVRMLATDCPVFAIGDPDQAVYGFRGSSPVWFHRFIEEQNAELHTLRTNYRSGTHILQAAGKVIEHNHAPDDFLPAVSAGPVQGTVYRFQAADPAAEGRFIADQIQLLVGGTSHLEIDRLRDASSHGMALSDIAVLYRTSRQAEPIAAVLAERGIPFQVVDVQPFYRSGDAKIVYLWILLAAGLIDKAELLFLLSREKGIGSKALAVADRYLAVGCQAPFAELIVHPDQLPGLLHRKVTEFSTVVDNLNHAAATDTVASAIDILVHRYDMDGNGPDLIRIKQLAEMAPSLAALGDHLRQHQDQVIYDERAESVFLATLHASKGLEFKAVFLTGCEEGLLPLLPRLPLEPGEELEHLREERRLFFVGMTRAARILYLLHAAARKGYAGDSKRTPSRFLADIPDELLQNPQGPVSRKRKKSPVQQLKLF